MPWHDLPEWLSACKNSAKRVGMVDRGFARGKELHGRALRGPRSRVEDHAAHCRRGRAAARDIIDGALSAKINYDED
jgi:hypothetical protein